MRTSSSWNSLQAALYQRVVQPLGSQVPSQRVAKELVTTAAIMPNRLRTKKPTSAQTAIAHSLAPMPVPRTMSALPAAGRAAIQEPARGEHRDDDGELHEGHDQGDGR